MLDTLYRLGSRVTRFFGEPPMSLPRASNQESECLTGVPFADLLPYEAYDETHGIFIGPRSIGFTLEAVPIIGCDRSVESLINSLFHEHLEEGDSIQCLLLADHRTERFLTAWESARANANQTLKVMANRRAQHFAQATSICPRIFRFILSYSRPTRSQYETLLLERFGKKRQKLLEALKPMTYAKSWHPNDLLECVGGLVNMSLTPHVLSRQWNPMQSLASQLPTGGNMAIHEDGLTIDTDSSIAFKSYRAVTIPGVWTLNGMQNLIGDALKDNYRINTPFYLHYGVHCPFQSSVEASFWRKTYLVENQGRSGTLLRWVPELEKELVECDQIRRSLHRGSRFVWTQLSAGIWGHPKTIEQPEQALKSLFRMHQIHLADNRCVHLPQFLGSLPMSWADYAPDFKKLNLLRTTLSTECANFVPIQAEWMGTATPQMLLLGRRGQLMNWNPFDNKTGNYNVTVVGKSGSGKSVFMQDLLLTGLSTGAIVYIIDVGRSFEKLCQMVEGQQIEFSKESQICLNPFTNISLTDDDERDAAFSVLKSIVGYMAAPSEGTSDFENALLEQAIRAAWDLHKQNATVTTIADWLENHQDQRAKTLGTMLTPYTKKGIYARHFEGRNNVNFTNPMVLVELEELKGKKDLQSVVLQLFIMTITQKALLGDRKTPFFICIDEAWDLLRGQQSAPFIETLARRLRKYNGSLVIGTQSLEDFFSTPGARAAFDNSDWTCLLSQKSSSLAALTESKKIVFSEGKRQALESLSKRDGEYSEVMISDSEGNYSIGRLILDPFSNLLYTTKAQDFTAIRTLQTKGLSIAEAIEYLLKTRQSHAS